MKELLNQPLFGLAISILAFELSRYIYEKTKLAIFNPLFVSITLVITFLLVFHIKIDYYNKGGSIISFFLFPATVILAVPLYKQIALLKAHALPILLGITIGCTAGIISVIYLIKAFGLTGPLATSLIPKSITAPIGIEISKQMGGIPQITVAAIIITGIIGAIIGPKVCQICKIRDKIAVGVAMGTSSHAAGTSKAVELGETQGAMSSLAIGLAGLITIFLVPLLVKIL